ncbi:hypothetical protein ACFQ1S_09840 [Kibdelosporangium lantanae]|uniref:Uncharacterized protein n=1 Tax=Kibdelosporangium lantanae TaxID=1497396 RepID=A0ABW3M5B3_9PSEU
MGLVTVDMDTLAAEFATHRTHLLAVAYRQLQRTYVENPTMVALAGVDHTYLLRRNWTGYQEVMDGTAQDATWGPWWNLESWKPR